MLRLGLRRHAAQAQLERHRSQVHAGALRQPRIFGVLDDAQAHARRGGQRLAHHAVFQNRMAVVGDGHGARGLERGIVVERLALRSARGRGDGKDANRRAALRRLHPAGNLRRIVHRDGVGHGGHGGKAARRCRRRAGGDGLLVALARLAQVHVHVDQPRRHGQPGGVQHFGAVGLLQLAGAGDLGHAAVLEQNVLERVHARRRIDQMSAANHQSRHARPPCRAAVSARSTTAMRMATPLRDLFQNRRLRAVGDAGRHLQPANDRPRMQHQAVGACAASRWPVSW